MSSEIKYPIVYDKLETEFTSHGLAILDKVIDPQIGQNLKGSYTFTFKIPYDHNAQYIQKRNYIKCDGQIFIIQKYKKIGQNKQLIEVYTEHVSYELIDYERYSVEYIAKTYEYILNQIFSGTGFTLITNSFVQNNITDFFYEPSNGIGDARKKLIEFVNQIEAEINWNNYYIEVLPSIGSNNGVKLRRGKNIKGIREETNGQTQVTRIIPIGREGLDITSVNGGVPYLDADNISEYKHPITKAIDFKDVDDPNNLKTKGQEYLDKNKYGNISIEVDFIELENHPIYKEYSHLEKVNLGDTVNIVYEPFDINDVPARIVSYSYNPINKKNSKITLANYKAYSLNDYFIKYEKASKTVDYAFTANKQLNQKTLYGLTIQDTEGNTTFRIDEATKQVTVGSGAVDWTGITNNPFSENQPSEFTRNYAGVLKLENTGTAIVVRDENDTILGTILYDSTP